MYVLSKSNTQKPNLLVNPRGQVYDLQDKPISHRERIKHELEALGVTKYDMVIPNYTIIEISGN